MPQQSLLKDVKNVLIFGAHGDDEIIGCGATLAWLADQGCNVTVVTFTRRETAYATLSDKETAGASADTEMKAADDVLGVTSRIVLGIPNQSVVNDRDTFQTCVKLIRKYTPDIIFTHSPSHREHHRDHRSVSLLVDEARWKALENLSPDWGALWETKLVLHYEIFDGFEKPHIITTFSQDYLDKKLQAMATQVTQLPVLRGIEQQLRGKAMFLGGFAGGENVFGEAFMISDFHPTRIHLN